MDDRAVRAWLSERAAEHRFSGSVLVWQDGAPTFRFVAGLAHRGHGVPVTEETRFAVASISKIVTATAALRLVERGVLRLDQPVVDVLPVEQHFAALTPEITLHHLLAQTSGLENYFDDDAEGWDSFTSCWDRVPTYRVRRPADLLPLIVDLPAHKPPGEEYRYCDTNFVLAGLVLEAATGRPYGEVVHEEVLDPAGMVDTGVEHLDTEPRHYASGYMVDDGPPEGWTSNIYSLTASPMPDGGLITTPVDLARLIDALRGGTLVGADTFAAMTRPQGPPTDDVEQYGYGCLLAMEGGRPVIFGHGGFDPGVSALLSHFVDQGITVVVVCNLDRGGWPTAMYMARAIGRPDPRE